MDKNNLNKSHQDPTNWKWGVIYYNKNDRRIFPPKRNAALGWTINFANRNSVLVFLAFFILITVPLYFILHKK